MCIIRACLVTESAYAVGDIFPTALNLRFVVCFISMQTPDRPLSCHPAVHYKGDRIFLLETVYGRMSTDMKQRFVDGFLEAHA